MKKKQITNKIRLFLLVVSLSLFSATVAVSSQCVSPDTVEPRAEDVYMLELINRARSNPDAEAERYGIDLNEGVSSESTITNDPKPPLAFNRKLHQAALAHSNDMLENDYFSHYTAADNSSPNDRALLQEYDEYSGENIVINMSTGPLNIDQETTDDHHAMLFIDENYPNRGHRVNMLNPNHVEGGVGIAYGDYVSSRYWPNAVASTTDFGRGESPAYLCGVIYEDKDGDAFYDVGEGLPNVTLTILERGESVYGFNAGAYSFPMMTRGTFTLEAYLCDHDARAVKMVEVGTENVKVDFLLSDFQNDTGELPIIDVPVLPSDDCATLSINQWVLPQTEAEMADSPVQLSTPSAFFFKPNDLTISVDMPCYANGVDIYLALYTVNGVLYFVTEGSTQLTTEFLPLIVNTTQRYESTFTANDMLRSLLGVYWLIVPSNSGDASTIDFGGKLQLGYMDITPLW